MTSVLIKETSPEGKKAIAKHVEELKKLSMKNRMLFKASGYKHEILSEDPFEIRLSIKNRYADNPTFLDLAKGEIIKSLKENGAQPEKDFSVEVIS